MEITNLSAVEMCKGLIKDEDPTIYLSSFINQAKSFTSKDSDTDIVKEYLQLSGNAKEILQLVKAMPSTDYQKALLIMESLCHILVRVVNDLNAFANVGISIANEILAHGMKGIFTFLKDKKTSRTKVALHLLSGMIAVGGQTAHQVVFKLDFSNVIFTQLLNRKSLSGEETVRIIFIKMIILILTTNDTSAIYRLIETKGLLNDILHGLTFDRVDIIVLVLSTYRKMIVENPAVSKTLKLKLFSDHSLKSVARLYSWKGPMKGEKMKKRKLGDEEKPVAFEASEEEIRDVQTQVHELMLYLFCSFKTGIIFKDTSFGSSGKNQNHVLTNLLAQIPKPHCNKLVADFVIKVLKTCPDQMVFYLPLLKASCAPRSSSSLWVDAMNVLKEIVRVQDPVSCLFKEYDEEKKPVSVLINIAKSICFPNVIKPSAISEAFKNGEPYICYHLCDYLIHVLDKVREVIEFCIQGDFSKMSYSPADIASFKQSFLTTVFHDFLFMRDIEKFWEKLTFAGKQNSEEKANIDLPIPSLSLQLSKILEVLQHFLFASHHGFHEYEVNVSKIFLSLKGCHSLLTHEEICGLNIKIIDIISAQGDEIVSLWNQSLIDSPLTVLLDVYLTSPSESMVEDVLQILQKVLAQTKLFEFCPWEIDVWLESMKSSKRKFIPYIIEFFNHTVCYLLQNANEFSDDIINSTFGKSSSSISFDVSSMLNDLLSTDKDPILIENFEETNSVTSTPKLCFSSLVPAALFNFNSVEEHKKKGCHYFVEKVLYHVMHHQDTPEVLFAVIQKYKGSISDNLYEYFELLNSGKSGLKDSFQDENSTVVCPPDLSEHLMVKFISTHTSNDSSKGCQCEIDCKPQNLNSQYKEKVVWQLLTYMNWEINLFLEDKIHSTDILSYLSLLKIILNSFDESSVSSCEMSEAHNFKQVTLRSRVLEEILSRPPMLKLFLWIEKVSKAKQSVVKQVVNNVTKFVLSSIAEEVSSENPMKILTGFKDKVVKFNSYYFQTLNLPRNLVMLENPDVCHIITLFQTMYSCNDVTYMLEDLLNLEIGEVKLENYFSTMMFIFKLYTDLSDLTLLSPKATNSLFIRYTELNKKEKKTVKDYILMMFEKHPILASVVNADSCHLLLKQQASKNFYILGCLIDCNKTLRQTIQSAITENLDELINTPDFIYLVSKCLLNSVLDGSEDTNFLETVAALFWEKVTSYILFDITSPDHFLESADTGKAVQLLFHRKVLAVKKMSKFFKANHEVLFSTVPCSSRMIIFLQFMEILKVYKLECSKTSTTILKLAFYWLSSTLASFRSISDFNYFHLIQFISDLLQDTTELNCSDFLDTESFLQKTLKIALKYKRPGHQLIEILTILCKKSQNSDFPVPSLFSLVTGHSNFFNIMLSSIRENESWKESVVELLITLVERDRSVCRDSHVGLLLSSYTGSLKSCDRKLLYLIKLYSESDVDMGKFSPFLWSKNATHYYSVMNNETMNLWKKPKLQDLLSIFSLEMLQKTVEKYPLTLKLESYLQESNEELRNISDLEKIYDLRFFLPIFTSAFSPGSFVHCKSFFDSRVLMIIFTSLSSFDVNTRALGYYCLSQLYFHLEGAYYADKEIWLCLLDSLRNSITSENSKLPNIVTLFLSRVTFIFTKPDHPLYTALYRFILAKPDLDIGHVPEFYKLFNSLEVEHRVYRMWFLNLLKGGLRSSLDFHICEKRHIFSLLLTHYWSSIASSQEKILVLDILSAAVKIDSTARILCQNSILSWLHNVIQTCDSSEVLIAKSLCSVLCNLWSSSKSFCYLKPQEKKGDSEIKQNNIHPSFLNEFELVLLSFSKMLNFLDAVGIKTYLSILEDLMTSSKNCESGIEISNTFSVDHVSKLLESLQKLSKKERKVSIQTSNKSEFLNCSELYTKLVLLWHPDWSSNNEQFMQYQRMCILQSTELILQYTDMSSLYTSDLPCWLYKCLKEDKSNELVKLFLSTKGESCLRLILELFEKSLNSKNFFSNSKNTFKINFDLTESTSHHWLKNLLHFKKICKKYNLNPDLNLYHQITMIL